MADGALLVGSDAGVHTLGDGAHDLPGTAVVALATESARLWALGADGAILQSENGGWERSTQMTGPAGRSLLATEDGLLVGTAQARLFRLRRDVLEPVDAFDQVSGREDWYTPWGGPPDTRSMALDASGRVFANVHVGGIVRWTPGGSWEPTIDIDRDVHQVATHPEQAGRVFAATAYGLADSADGGDTWDVSDDGLHGSYARAVAVAGDVLLLTVSTGPFTKQAAIYRRPVDGEGPFQRCTSGLPEWFGANLDTYCLAALGHRVAVGTSEGELWVSEDQGQTWERAAEGLGEISAVLFAS
jgi:photosystem II stability/assembly factor-like uncharacterized protein